MTQNNKHICQICNQQKKVDDIISGELVRTPVVSIIKKKYPNWSFDGYICVKDLNTFINEYVENLFKLEKGELTRIDKEVLQSLKQNELLSENINVQFDRKLTFGEKLSDKIAEFGGSWMFIALFSTILLSWIIINSFILINKSFDPYPFILLNLVLSTLAAIQAPVILMSQNRQADRDRLRSEYDYKTNMKAELEIRHLNEKVDQLLKHQWKRLLEIQQLQMDLLQEWKKNK